MACSLDFIDKQTVAPLEMHAAYAAKNSSYIFNQWIHDHFNLPPVHVPDYSDCFDPQTAAEALRQEWGLGNQPIPLLLKLLELKGIRVFSFPDAPNIHSFSCWYDGIPYIFLNTTPSAERIRFNIGIELGHLILHRNLKIYYNKIWAYDIKKEANLFSGAFLMPEADIRSHIFNGFFTDQLIQIKHRWKVPVTALLLRLRQIGLLNEWAYRMIAIDILSKGYRKKEPNPTDREYSLIWQKIFQHLWKHKVSRTAIAKSISLPEKQINKLINGLLPNHSINNLTQNKSAPLKLV